jgi:hypothetical protein
MADLRNSQGKVKFLRAHDVGSGWGPPTDQLDVEAIFMLTGHDGEAYGFQLRSDGNRPAREAMFALLRDAYVHDLTVSADYFIDPGKHNGRAIRIARTR